MEHSQSFFQRMLRKGKNKTKQKPPWNWHASISFASPSINGRTLSLVLLLLITYRMFSFNYSIVKTTLKALGSYFIAFSMTKMLLRVKRRRFGGCIVHDLINSGDSVISVSVSFSNIFSHKLSRLCPSVFRLIRLIFIINQSTKGTQWN